MSLKKLLYWLPVILCIIIIYQSSAQTYQEQDLRPWLRDILPEEWIMEHFSDWKITYDGREISIATKGVPAFVEFIIRKTAHVVAFATFSFVLLYALWHTSKLSRWKMILLTLAVSFLFAVSDELHQMYTGDRSPRFADVKIDTIGAILGIIIYLFVRIVRRRTKS